MSEKIPVSNIFKRLSGTKVFHPKCINWSYLNRGKVQRIHIKVKMKKNIFAKSTKMPMILTAFADKPRLCMKGKLYPPKYKVEIIAEEINILIYSANK